MQKNRYWNRLLLGVALASGIGASAFGSEGIEACALRAHIPHVAHIPTIMTLSRILELPDDTDVQQYDLQVKPNFSGSSLKGLCTARVRCVNNGVNQFHIRLDDALTINSVKIGSTNITYVREDPVNVSLILDRAYNAGEEFSVTIDYEGVTDGGGFGSIIWGTRASGARYVFTLSEPDYAFTWWPAKDLNYDKAIMRMSVITPASYVAVSNGKLANMTTLGTGELQYDFAPVSPMAPYLLHFAVSNFTHWTKTFTHAGGTMPVEFYIYPENDNTTNRTAWENCLNMLATYAPWYGPYPFLDDQYGIYQFGFGGGMEHQTMTGQGTWSESVTAHELGHQWWGDMITCRDFHHIWLNEGFATYTEAIWLEKKAGSTGLPALKAAMAARKPSNVNGTVWCPDVTDVNRIFSTSFTYRKGGWVLHQLRKLVGDANFFAILAEYRNRFQYGAATTEDFQDVCEDIYGQDLDWFFTQWIYQPGAIAYSWGWQTTTSNGKNYLLVRLAQTQSTSYPTFITPVDIRPTVGGVKQPLKVWNDARTQHFVLPLTGPATACTIDEDGWILTTGVTSATYSPGPPKIVESTAPNGVVHNMEWPGSASFTFHTGVSIPSGSALLLNERGSVVSNNFSYNASTNTVTIFGPRRLSRGNYSFVLTDAIKATNSNMALDGELSGTTLPSGNGVAGGTAVFRFTIR